MTSECLRHIEVDNFLLEQDAPPNQVMRRVYCPHCDFSKVVPTSVMGWYECKVTRRASGSLAKWTDNIFNAGVRYPALYKEGYQTVFAMEGGGSLSLSKSRFVNLFNKKKFDRRIFDE